MSESLLGAENLEWIANWREGMFSSSSRDQEGWPIEMHGVVASWEKCLDALEHAHFALEDLLEWAQRHRGGDPSLDPEEYYAARDFAWDTLAKIRDAADD